MAERPNKNGVEPVAKESMESLMVKDLMCEDFTCILRASDEERCKPPHFRHNLN